MRARVTRAAAVLAVLVLLAGACGIDLGGGDPPRRARVVITSATGAEARLLTSLDFVVGPGGDVDTGSTDPSLIALPFEGTYDLLDPPRLFVRITPADSTSTFGVSLRVFFDGERFSSQSDSIGTEARPAMEFLYRFSSPTL